MIETNANMKQNEYTQTQIFLRVMIHKSFIAHFQVLKKILKNKYQEKSNGVFQHSHTKILNTRERNKYFKLEKCKII